MSYNEMLNHMSQSTASDMTISAMNILVKKHKVMFMIHDDLTLALKNDETLEENIREIIRVMCSAPWKPMQATRWDTTWIPLQVEVEIGDKWGDQKHLITMDSIKVGLDSRQKCIDYADSIDEKYESQIWN